ncbi:MAG: molecular chaperone HtpG [Streptosporangiaceae bacterium]
MSAPVDQESFSFQAEVVQILDLMVHSLYSNKEIFLRELISNASDAIDRLRLELLAQAESPEAEGPLQIRVSYDAGARTITVADNGIGMSRAEVIEHIGTIAKSGTREFLHALTGDQRADASLIGQFGVGFYSAFIVADRVELITRRAALPAEDAVRWESDGRGSYTLEPATRPGRGTTVVLHLRDGEDELLNGYRLRSIIQKYSDHISLPIVMPAEGGQADTGSGDAEGGQEGEGADEPVNQAAALWTRPKSEISDQDYRDFYRHLTGDITDPLAWLHAKMEGTYEYTLLLFIPGSAPFDLWIPESAHGVKLHVQRVFIMADSGQLMPAYLRFVRGVIDSSDLPLNVSRELLQGSRAVSHIRSSAVKRVLKLLADMAANEPDKYATFWSQFGAVLKEGIPEDYTNRDSLARLLRFSSTANSTASSPGEASVSLNDYVARMKEGQDSIYYLLAPGAAAASSPHLEAFRAKGVEVLLLTEPVDGWVVTGLHEFNGHRLQSVAQGAAGLGGLEDEAEKAAAEKAGTEFAALAGRLKELLGDQVYDVRVSSRLTTSPACIVANEPDIEMNLVRRMRGSGVPSQPVLEINPGHPLVERLNHRLDDPRLDDWAHVLFSQAVLTLGARIEDPAAFVNRMNDLLEALTVGGEAADGAEGRSGKAAGGTAAKGRGGKAAGAAQAKGSSAKTAGGAAARGGPAAKDSSGKAAGSSAKPAGGADAEGSSGKPAGGADAEGSSGKAAGGGGPAGSGEGG